MHTVTGSAGRAGFQEVAAASCACAREPKRVEAGRSGWAPAVGAAAASRARAPARPREAGPNRVESGEIGWGWVGPP